MTETEPGISKGDPAAGGREKIEPMDTVSFGAFEMHPIVFPAAVTVVIVLMGFAIALPGEVENVFQALQDGISQRLGWLYILLMSGFLAFALWLGFGRFGHVRLGGDDERPEFGALTWFAMLFSAGMGIGLVFWSVAEPIEHFTNPPVGRGADLDAARTSMALTIFHWGFHAWALYAIVALSLAYFGFRRKLPLSFRSLLYPIFKDRVHGRLGDVVDVLAVVSTLVGVATSLGLGAMQVNSGLNMLLGMPIHVYAQVLLIAGITAIATVSVVLGLHAGIRRLSEFNMSLAAILLLFVIFGGGVFFFFNAFVENIGAYLQRLPYNAFWTGTFDEPEVVNWLGDWTVFYWGWWISWSPFVGMFIARVSRGRTIREFITGVLLVPTLVCIVWLTAFGSNALNQELRGDPPEDAVYQVQVTDDETGLAVSKDGALVGPGGGVYTRNEQGGLVARGTGTEVRIEDSVVVAAETGLAYTPSEEARFDGTYAAQDERMTAVQYLSTQNLLGTNQRDVLNYDQRLSTVLFVLLEDFPLFIFTATIATLCIILFFVTSSDSASMVIDIIASGGNPDPPVGTRLFWAITEGVVASILLLAGGLDALQTASITAALPFSLVLIVACGALVIALFRHESQAAVLPGGEETEKPPTAPQPSRQPTQRRGSRVVPPAESIG